MTTTEPRNRPGAGAEAIDGAAMGGRPVGFPAYDPDAVAGTRKILLVEDEPTIVQPLADALSREGFETHVATTAAEGTELGTSLAPDLILLDLMLPDGSGYEVCRELRRTSQVPIVMLTARGEEVDRVIGLELGADDYIVKPFSAREVIARVRAVLRRAGTADAAESGTLRIDGLELDPGRRSVELDGEPVEVSRKEFELLRRLMIDAGNVVTREALIEDVWDMNWFGSTKTLDVHVSSVRKKLGDDPEEPRFIHTVRGVGFRFSAAGEAAD